MQQSLKMQTTLWMVVMMVMVALTASVPVFDDDVDSSEAVKRPITWSRLLGVSPNYLMPHRRFSPAIASRLFSEQKRYRPPMQSRSGGMSLCLWKVCPAAPWLVTKRESSDY